MQRNIIIVGILLVVILALGYAFTREQNDNTNPVVSNTDEMAIRTAITEFGTRLQNVSLLSPEANRRQAMEENYGPYVAPELIDRWAPEGAEALGRYSSSPWPERIEIVEVRPQGDRYIVEGNVIEVTSVEAGTGKSAAAVYPITLTLEKRGSVWMIKAAEKGAYSEIPRQQAIVGFWECLPHKDTNGPQTLECAFGIAVDQSDGHFAVNTSLMSEYPVDFPTGTKVRVTGLVVPANQLSSEQKYDIDGVINAISIEKL